MIQDVILDVRNKKEEEEKTFFLLVGLFIFLFFLLQTFNYEKIR